MSVLPMTFAHPEFASGLVLWAALVLGLVLLERRGSGALDRLVGVPRQQALVVRPAAWRRWMRIALLGVSGCAMIVALMQPQFGLRFVATPRAGAEIMIALDVSRSMLADDAKPSRLERAKAEISDLLSYLEDDYVGLIVFAGRASVLSPMTPDKSFLRLALESAGPHSVSRGGTKLAEPIQRAVSGMGEPGPAQRALILITDGEDHDSFAMDAAREAAEAGIKIIAIGFGSEAGSEIYSIDPRTGARSLVRDADGQPVVSRLDGDLLRDIALVTDGAFVPAGTGVLDLASIYRAHIAKLTRGQLDERGRSIRDEAFQFFVLLALICLVGAVFVTSVRGGAAERRAGVAIALLLLSAQPGRVEAQTGVAESAETAEAAPSTGTQSTTGAEEPPASTSSEDPRTRFNRANAQLDAGDAIAASALLRDVRRDATDDPELRYAATYNLGIAAVARAEALRESQPAESLEALYEAADWFREAASARSDATDPRHNLDVTLRLALILSDEIASQSERELDAELDAMIGAQRTRVGQAAALLEQVMHAGELAAAESLRPAFRDAATAQRILMSDASALGERIERERQQLAALDDAEQTPEGALEAAQLEAVLTHLDSAIDRMGQARRQLRQRRAERAYRRSASALGDLKRARDQLRDPVQQIGILLAEVGRLARSTGALARSGLPEADAPTLPAFLNRESLEAGSGRLESRVDELAARFGLAAEQAGRRGAGDPSDAAAAVEAVARELALQEAAPLVADASQAMRSATAAIGLSDYDDALVQEARAAEALAAAQERFFDLRQLLNATHADQQQIAHIAASEDPDVVETRSEHVARLAEVQAKNRLRGLRLADLLDRERDARLARLESEREADASPPEDPSRDPIELEKHRFELADRLLDDASESMSQSSEALEAQTVDWSKIDETAERAAGRLDALRTLFFSIVEHVQKLALDQSEVRDRTREAVALSVTERSPERDAAPEGDEEPLPTDDSGDARTAEGASPERGPHTQARARALAVEQRALESRGGEIADALFVQAEQTAAAAAPNAEAEDAAVSPEERDRIRRAAEKVASAQLAMREAGETLEAGSAPLEAAPAAQDLAIEELKEALRLLSPPPEQGSDSPPDRPEQGEGEAQPQDAPEQRAGQGPPPHSEAGETDEESMDDAPRLLQGVRDRAAERRREREREQQRRRGEPVDKDW